jgi:hypothetical protein
MLEGTPSARIGFDNDDNDKVQIYPVMSFLFFSFLTWGED